MCSFPKKHQQENDLQRLLANLGGTVSHTNAKHCNITVKLAWENSRHLATLPLVCPPNDVWKTSAEIPYWWRVTTQVWVVLLCSASDWSCRVGDLIQPIRGTTQIWVVTLHQYGTTVKFNIISISLIASRNVLLVFSDVEIWEMSIQSSCLSRISTRKKWSFVS